MKRDSIIASTLALVAGAALHAPAPAAASGPLLSGYGGPGSGSQVILGSTLLGAGGSGGSSQGGAAGGSEGGTAGAGSARRGIEGSASRTAGSQASAAGRSAGAPGAHRRGSSGESLAGGSATHHGAAGATPKISSLQDASAASNPWFSGADALALLLAAGVLALVGLATVRLARAPHHQGAGRR